MIYSAEVMDHFFKSKKYGSIENSDGIGAIGNAKYGDAMKIYLKIEGDMEADAKFQTLGCEAIIAASSMATELIKGIKLEEAWILSNKTVAEAYDGLPPTRMHCSLLAEEAIHEAINNYLRRKGLNSWIE